MLSEKGSLKDFSVMKLLLNVYNEELTGILYLKKDTIIKVLYFKKGRLIWAISNSDTDKLENMLISKGKITQKSLDELNMPQDDQTESTGKILVEKGIITLGELIEFTKIQLEKIIYSVLAYEDGNYQFTTDLPPKRLLSLDIDITGFIRNFILDEIDVDKIWNKLNSLQTSYIKTKSINIEKYNFSKNQTELLNAFQEGKKLEHIMAKYSSDHKESLLKIIYFFFLADLIEEFKESSQQDSDYEEVIDNTLNEAISYPEKEEFKSDIPEPEPPTPTPDTGNYTFGEEDDSSDPQEDLSNSTETSLNNEDVEIDLETQNEDEDILEIGTKEQLSSVDQKSESVEHLLKEEETKTKSKKFIYAFFVFIVLIGLSIYFILNYFIGEEKNKIENISLHKMPVQKEKSTTPATTDKKDSLSINPNEEQDSKKSITPETPDIQNKEKTSNNKPKINQDPVINKKTTDKKTTPSIPESALKYFKDNKFIVAADIWKNQIIQRNSKFSILLEMDCLKESVKKAYKKIKRKPDFFILTTNRNNRICYLVFIGQFKSRIEAENALRGISDFFFLQQNPPVIVELEKYLK